MKDLTSDVKDCKRFFKNLFSELIGVESVIEELLDEIIESIVEIETVDTYYNNMATAVSVPCKEFMCIGAIHRR